MPPLTTPAATVPFATALSQAPLLVIHQKRSLLENFTGVEARGRFAVYTPDGAFTAGFAEHAEGLASFLGRWFLDSNRPFVMGLYPSEHPSQPLLILDRPWSWLFARLELREAGSGRVLGRVRQRWGWFRKRMDLEGPDGRPLARLVGPLLRPWTILIQVGPESNPREVGQIDNNGYGAVTEIFTDADTFLVTLPQGDATLRALVLAAAVLVDFVWFEHRG